MPNEPLKGAICGLAAALLFGVSAPIAKLLLGDIAPVLLAGLLYAGAALGVWGYRLGRQGRSEAPLRKADVPSLVVIAVSGGLLAPVLMLYGLSQVPAFAGSLLLNLEAPFTVILAVLLFREHLGGRGTFAVVAITSAAVLLSAQPAGSGESIGSISDSIPGAIMIAGACACWALDNNLTQKLSLRDPFAVVRVKTLTAGLGNTALGLVLVGFHVPAPELVLGALALGCVSYGASVVLDAYALRYVGAAREAAYFATAPFVGAMSSIFIFDEDVGVFELTGLALMTCGVVALLKEKHGHEHTHEAMTHEHLHVHDEHHQHSHEGTQPTGEPHSHVHVHEPLRHDHPHMPDVHHRHRH